CNCTQSQDRLGNNTPGSINPTYMQGGGFVALTINYRPESVPVTVFSGYRFDQIEPSMSGASLGHANVSTIFAGLRFSFGSSSLKDEERNGPVWTASSLLP
ncbi:hypothetical protein HNQ66_004705, partial [Shinella fusca]|nr:hypothetical protein [Shinella fusca]